MTRKIPLTLEQHRTLGAALHAIDEQVMNLACDTANCLSRRHRAVAPLFRAHDRLLGARSRLDDLLCRHDPDHFDTRIYYPGSKLRPGRSRVPLGLREAAVALEEIRRQLNDALNTVLRALPISSPAWKCLERTDAELSKAQVRIGTAIIESK